MIKTREEFEKSLHTRLRETGLFTLYQDAFQNATGLPLMLVGVDDPGECISSGAANHGSFCEALHLCKSACRACVDTNHRLLERASVQGPSTCHCFAGLVASAVPVNVGASVIGYLKTGQVFTRIPDEEQFDRVMRAIGKKTLGKGAGDLLHKAYFQTRTVEPSRYASMVTLSEIFAAQLSQHAESLAVLEAGRDPLPVVKARHYIEEHLGEAVSLSKVAKVAGLSESHFCRLFRKITGLTLTEYVNRSRIEWAKGELLKKGKRASEIAFEVGYQSISQFNRNFRRLTGLAPTAWRQTQIKSKEAAAGLWAAVPAAGGKAVSRME
jgi:AraC-like DNA-binding protein/ligand-binding sensor protein